MNTKIFTITDPQKQADELREAAQFIKSGEIVAFPTETVYGLGANALDGHAVKKIFEAKGRPQDNPLIVHITEIEELYPLVKEVPESVKRLTEKYWPGPLTVILPKSDIIPPEVSAGLDTVAVRCPSHPVARAFLKAAGVPVAAPSANISGFPSPTAFKYVYDDMNTRIPAMIDGGDCDFGIESTVVTLATDPPRLLRPGAVTLEQLRGVLGEVYVDPAVLNPLADGVKAASPGMKYKHYAPKAEVSVVRGNKKEFIEYVNSHPTDADTILCFEGEENDMPLPCVTMGRADDPLTQSHRLFDALRELDETGAKHVFSRAPSEKGVGLGVCNRLYRSAAFRFLNDIKSTVIGVTGGTGAGKSTVCGEFERNGAAVVDADRIAREVTEKGSPVLKKLAERFGSDIIAPDGSLLRHKLAERAFSSAENTRDLTNITHPEIIKRCRAEVDALRGKYSLILLDAPLLFTSGLDKICDKTVRVTSPESVRISRIMKRDGISEDEAKKRAAAQTEEERLAENADITIDNTDHFVIPKSELT